MDVGSGTGTLSIHAALSAARRVVGADPSEVGVSVASEALTQHYPDVADRVRFVCAEIGDLAETFDMAVSMAVLEHVLDVPALLADLKDRLVIGGTAFIGFGPLFRAPWGDHQRLGAPLNGVFPWAHLVFLRSWMLARLNRRLGDEPASSIQDLALNGLRLGAYLSALDRCALEIDYLEINVHENRMVTTVLNALRRLPGLNDLLAVNVYCVLRRSQ